MKKTLFFGLIAVAAALAVTPTGAVVDRGGPDRDHPPPIPDQPHRIGVGLLHAERFDLGKPQAHFWRAERPLYDSGWLVVLSVDPTLVFARQTEEPVLYVGGQTAERVNNGSDSGRVVAIVPGDFQLTEAEIFFGTPMMPERVDWRVIEREIGVARSAGVTPPSADQVGRALQNARRHDDHRMLYQRAIELVAEHSPVEQDLIRGFRVPAAEDTRPPRGR